MIYVAKKLSGVQATDGKERTHGDVALPVRQVRLEGLTSDLARLRRRERFGELGLFLVVGLLQGLDVELAHLHHGLVDSFCFLGVFVAHQLPED